MPETFDVGVSVGPAVSWYQAGSLVPGTLWLVLSEIPECRGRRAWRPRWQVILRVHNHACSIFRGTRRMSEKAELER